MKDLTEQFLELVRLTATSLPPDVEKSIRKAYEVEEEGSAGTPESSTSTPSIHDLEDALRFAALPPVDKEDRAIFQERVLPGDLTLAAYRDGDYPVLHTWATTKLRLIAIHEGGAGALPSQNDGSALGNSPAQPLGWVELILQGPQENAFEKRIRIEADGSVEVHYRWDGAGFASEAWFATELSLAAQVDVSVYPEAEEWRFPIATFSKSERGFDETVQGESLTVRWPVRAGSGRVRIASK